MLTLLILGCTRSAPPLDTSAGHTAAPDTQLPTDTDSPALPEVLVVVDGADNQILYVRPDTGDLLYTVDLPTVRPALCADPMICVAYGVEHQRSEAGDDLLTLTFHRVERLSKDGHEVAQHGSMIERYRLTEAGPEVVWSLNAIDLSGFPGTCSADPCTPPDDVPAADWRSCVITGVHDIELVTDTESLVELWLADTSSRPRAMKLSFEPGSTCAQVTELLDDASTEGWSRFEHTNDLDVTATGVLVNHKGTSPEFGGAVGRGKTTHWVPEGDGWALEWEHPPEDGTWLNAPHNPDLVTTEAGEFLIYAHSNGAGSTWEDEGFSGDADNLGSVGVARMGADGPTYLFDAVLSGDSPLGFVRDADLLSDGSFLLTDSGCNDDVTEVCPRPGLVRRVELPLDTASTGGSGAWLEGATEQQLVTVSELDTPWPLACDLHIPYESDLLEPQALGEVLRARLDAPESSCTTAD